jgi:hypothetical protein
MSIENIKVREIACGFTLKFNITKKLMPSTALLTLKLMNALVELLMTMPFPVFMSLVYHGFPPGYFLSQT